MKCVDIEMPMDIVRQMQSVRLYAASESATEASPFRHITTLAERHPSLKENRSRSPAACVEINRIWCDWRYLRPYYTHLVLMNFSSRERVRLVFFVTLFLLFIFQTCVRTAISQLGVFNGTDTPVSSLPFLMELRVPLRYVHALENMMANFKGPGYRHALFRVSPPTAHSFSLTVVFECQFLPVPHFWLF